MVTKTKTTAQAQYVIVANERYGLYCGELVSHACAWHGLVRCVMAWG
jgi:hypothetical protein